MGNGDCGGVEDGGLVGWNVCLGGASESGLRAGDREGRGA